MADKATDVASDKSSEPFTTPTANLCTAARMLLRCWFCLEPPELRSRFSLDCARSPANAANLASSPSRWPPISSNDKSLRVNALRETASKAWSCFGLFNCCKASESGWAAHAVELSLHDPALPEAQWK
eukprot:CAMPEP_0115567320 /NCGR_PEP_ID=MMETSP0271-20121206/104049_1 /TAXON_ID=71861 /ORGANISM="Scrippsiella trochoidea, Strain CCMP3099" /LENGTH=127 /DNA_ID=CAMNT_0003001675 /DNA_START=801 /DNA_END=1181 /DNA_ORIENTATION=+